jgi:hypothetical protein
LGWFECIEMAASHCSGWCDMIGNAAEPPSTVEGAII